MEIHVWREVTIPVLECTQCGALVRAGKDVAAHDPWCLGTQPDASWLEARMVDQELALLLPASPS